MFSKSKLTTLAAAIICGGIFAGCSQEQETEAPKTGTASVTIEVDRSFTIDSTTVSVKFIPSENTASFRYAIGLTSDFESFRDGTMSTSESVTGNEPLEKTFEGLEPISMYSVYAVATDENGNEGSIATCKIVTDNNDFSVQNSFLLSRSAAFYIRASSDYSSVNYYLGQDGDLDAFLAGTVESTTLKNFDEMTINYFDLEPDTDYTFFAQIIDRFGITAKVVEYPVHTPAEGECPAVEFSYENDIYTGTYTLKPVSGTSRIAAIINTLGTFDNLIYNTQNWKGDIMNMIDTWKDIEAGQVFQSEGSASLEIEFTTPTLVCGTEIELYALLYDESGNPYGISRFTCSTPLADPNAPEATATVTVRDITTSGATYDYTMGEGTLACMYETVDADWLDNNMESDSYYEFYLHDYLFAQGFYFHYNDGTESGANWSYTETTGQPGHRYYAVACPMNANGPTTGWGDMAIVEYWTLSE